MAVAQICQNIGWHAVQSSPLEVMVDIAHRYLMDISQTTHQYSNQYNRSEPNIVDLGLAFRLMGIQLSELEEYVNNVEPVAFAHQVAAFPLAHKSNFQFPKPKSRAVAQRPEWIHEYLPLTHPEQEEGEEELPPTSPEPVDGIKALDAPDSPSSSSSEDFDLTGSPISGIKRPHDGTSDQPHAKRSKLSFEDEGRPMRELVSIFMTPSGLISPAREGKLPDSRTPSKNIESTQDSLEILSSSSSSSSSVSLPEDISVKKPVKLIKRNKEKMAKFKKDMIMKKHIKKIKLSKNKSPTHGKFHTDSSPPSTVRRDGNIFPDLIKIKKKKKSTDSGMKLSSSKLKPAINKIRIAKDKSFRAKEAAMLPLPIMKTPKVKHKIKSPSHLAVGYPRSPKSPKGLKFHNVSKPKSPKMHFPPEKPHHHVPPPPPVPVPPPPVHKPAIFEAHEPIMPVKIEPLQARSQVIEEDDDCSDEEQSREDTPEPRLVIDDEAQARHEKESRMADLDECINAVIVRMQTEMESENKESDRNVDDAIDSVIKSSKKLEPRDVYDFTDSSDGGDSLPKTPKTPEPTVSSPPPKVKKEKIKSPPEVVCAKPVTPENPPKKKKERAKTPKRKPVKDKPRPALSFPKFGRSGLQEKRAPSPPLLDSDSSDIVSLPSPGPSTPSQNSPGSRGNQFNQFSPQGNSFLLPYSSLAPNKFPSMGFPPSTSPFSPFRPLPTNPFPTPPLFVTPKMEMSGNQMQPINLVSPTGGAGKSTERKHPPSDGNPKKSTTKFEDELDNKPSKSSKDHKKKPEKKEKVKKKSPKEKIKEKSKKFVPPSPPSPAPLSESPPPPPAPPPPPPPPVSIPEPPKKSVVEKKPPKPPKIKPEKKTKPLKIEKEKKKVKEKEEKVKEDPSSVPKITLKLGSSTPHSSGSTKIVIKSSGKGSRSCSPSPELPLSPPPPTRIKSPLPPPPPPVRGAAVAAATATAAASSSSGIRGRPNARGRGAPKRAASPTPCIVTTETLGTIMDESGNKIWICPACTRPDDGSPMIGCDECDDWYHWVCVGIVVPPKEEESWFCSRCISKRQSSGGKKRRKKHKKDK